ncbi:MAG: TetR/AcrR family transcriptional regulator, partial [Clostridium sp.]|nr:TetR/AcrR family transcriptional regulator [Clostridium sp.]
MPTNTFFNLSTEKKDNIINAAKSEFLEYSFHDASINRIIKDAGIARGSFYMYFENKEDLFLYILDGYREEALSEMLKGLNGNKCDIFEMAIYVYDYISSRNFDKEIYNFIIKTLHKVDLNLLNYFFKLDCSDIKIRCAKEYTDLSKISFKNDEELLNILEIIENIIISEMIAVFSGKYDFSIGKNK